MSTEVYTRLLEAGAPSLPGHLFYQIDQWHDPHLFADNEVVSISIYAHAEDRRPVRRWLWDHGFRWLLSAGDPYVDWVATRKYSLGTKHTYYSGDRVITERDSVLPTLAKAAAEMWVGLQEAHEAKGLLRDLKAEAMWLEGRHP